LYQDINMVSQRKVSLAAATTGTGASVDVGNGNYVTFYVTGTGTITGGTIILEESDLKSYAGTWSQLQSVTASSLSGGVVQAFHFAGAIAWVRARISSNITGGGTVDVYVRCDD
jgi:hypothetical protein